MITEGDIGWCAGLFEGEGTVVWISVENGRYGHIEFKINQADSPEILDRFRSIMGCGSVLGPYGPYKNSVTKKPMYVYQTFNLADIKSMFEVMRDNLSSRRITQFELAFSRAEDHRLSIVERNEMCRAGLHPKLGQGRCLPCKNLKRNIRYRENHVKV